MWQTTASIWPRSTVSNRLRVLVDANVVLDVLARRQPHYTASAQVWAAIEAGHADGLLAAHTVTTLHYLLERHTDHGRAISALTDVMRVFEIAPVDGRVLLSALALGGRDFEDAVQMAAAASAGATHVLTRNPADFRNSPVAVLQPAELAALLAARRPRSG